MIISFLLPLNILIRSLILSILFHYLGQYSIPFKHSEVYGGLTRWTEAHDEGVHGYRQADLAVEEEAT